MKVTKITVSILIVSRSFANINGLLRNISRSTLNASDLEVLVSWNGSEKDERRIDGFGLPLKIACRDSYHFASNMNKLALQAEGKYLCLLNDDLILELDAIENAIFWLGYSGVGLVGACLWYPNGDIQHCGVNFNDDGSPFHLYKKQSPERSSEAQRYINSLHCVQAVTGAFLACRKTDYLQVKLKEDFKECGEDICLSIDFRSKLGKSVLYAPNVRAIHSEGVTRKVYGKQGTPQVDLEKIKSYVRNHPPKKIKVCVETEEKGWIFYRKAEELQKNSEDIEVIINNFQHDCDIVYFIHQARYSDELAAGRIAIACFTHYLQGENGGKLFESAAMKVDHCIAISESTKSDLLALGVSEEKVTVIEVGADVSFVSKLSLGLVGRVYGSGRKGEHLVKRLLSDPEINSLCNFFSINDGWGVNKIENISHEQFYNLIDYLLIPSLIEGGPVPFMEALACGTLSVAPPIGVIPTYKHIDYPAGDYDALRKTVKQLACLKRSERGELTKQMSMNDWFGWAVRHEILFKALFANELHKNEHKVLVLEEDSAKVFEQANHFMRLGQYQRAIDLYDCIQTAQLLPQITFNRRLCVERVNRKRKQ